MDIGQAAEARKESRVVEQERREEQRKTKREQQLTHGRESIVTEMNEFPAGEIKMAIRNRAGIRTDRFDVAFAEPLSGGDS